MALGALLVVTETLGGIMALSTYDVLYKAHSMRYPGTIKKLRPRVLTNSLNSAMKFVKDNDNSFISIVRVYNEKYHSYP